jgi:hypothetical protein
VSGIDIERYRLTYKKNSWFSVSAGRFHTSLGYYNTAYHHGNWFSTAEGRPIMYLFEDSGGILPMHMVGLSFTGEVPHTEYLHLNWVAELGNGNNSNPGAGAAVQNLYSDRNYKATNVAAFIRPGAVQGLQIGGSWYHDGLNPSQAQSPAGCPQIRNLSALLPLSVRERRLKRSAESSAGEVLRSVDRNQIRFFHDAALKLQFNHLHQSSQLAGNGFDTQLAFTF